ncbi:MAG: DNAase [Gammaproteobacteria bacterium]|nr:MAG: DNAase [Gammaproteobacteria bacterium]
MPTLVDSHCHINFEDLASQIPDILANAADSGVDYMLCVSVNMEDFPEIIALSNEYPHIFASVGVHPNAQNGEDPGAERLAELALKHKVVAIGETGLDYFRSEGNLDWQKNRFSEHIEAAKKSGCPLIIHTRSAADDTMDMLRAENAEQAGGVMHCFAEDWNIARQALDIGFYISFSGIVTFKNAEAIKEVARKAPPDRILVETDAPYLAPVPLRGKLNQPAYVQHTARHVAELRGVPYEQLAEETTNNFFRLFSKAERLSEISTREA